MKIGIISDSHDHHVNVQTAVDIFNRLGVSYVLHAGDMVSPFAAKAFAGLETAKLIAVFGNNEGEKLFLKSVFDSIGAEIHEYCYKGTLGGKRIFMTHTPHYVEDAVKSKEYDLVIYGHTHKEDIRRSGDSLVINPGESTDWITGAGRVVILDLETMEHQSILL